MSELTILKKELMRLKKKMVKHTFKELDFANADYYDIYLKNGYYAIIEYTTKTFPDINFKDIVYINKCYVAGTHKNITHKDSLVGDYDIKQNFKYPKQIQSKYNVDMEKQIF